jgi:hypothetical protein
MSYSCPTCQKQYIRKHYLDKHIEKCKVVPNNNIIEQFKQELEQLKQELKEWIREEIKNQLPQTPLIKPSSSKPPPNKPPPTNINRVPFTEEDLSKLSQQDNIDIFNHGLNSYHEFIHTLHFSGKYPEYENITVDPVTNQLYVYMGNNKWVKENIDYAAKKTYESLMTHLTRLSNEAHFLKHCDRDWMMDTMRYIRLANFDSEAPRIINTFKQYRRGKSVSDEEFMKIIE